MRNPYRRLNISAKLALLILGVALSTVGAVAYLGWHLGTGTLDARAYDELTAIRSAKLRLLREEFAELRRDTGLIAEEVTTREALRDFARALADDAPVGVLPAGWDEALHGYYADTLVPALNAVSDRVWTVDALWPASERARQLQYRYLVAATPAAGSPYADAHARHDAHFTALAARFGFRDLMLVAVDGSTIVYSTDKEVDFGTRLDDGPWADSHLASVVQRAARLTTPGAAVIEDFSYFAPSHDEPVGFLAAPIRDGDTLLGVLAVELPAERVDQALNGDRNWRMEGLGETGETWVVGPDGLQRSNERFLLEDPDGYVEALRAHGASATELAHMRRHRTSILAEARHDPAVEAALAGASGTRVVTDDRGVRILTAYAPAGIEQLDWAIVAEIDLAEAHAPLRAFERDLARGTIVLALLGILLSLAVARFFVTPILALITASRGLGEGDWEMRVQTYTEDELGELASSFNTMADNLQEQTETIVERSEEKDRLLGFIRGVFGRYMSEEVAANLLASPERIVLGGEERDVTVLISDIQGYSTLSEHLPPQEVLRLLNDYFGALNEVIDRHRGVVIEYLGDGILAVFGAPNDLPDHPEQAVRCALAMRARLEALNAEWNASGRAELWQKHGLESLRARIGLHTGNVVAGNLGSESRMKYGVIGDTVNVAARLEALNKELGTTILASGALIDRLPPDLLALAEDRGTHQVKGRGGAVRVLSF